MDSLIRKACELGEKTAHCNVEVIVNATSWMEGKYRDAPNGKIAAMIALHYLMLAIRNESQANPKPSKNRSPGLCIGGKSPVAIRVGMHRPPIVSSSNASPRPAVAWLFAIPVCRQMRIGHFQSVQLRSC